jgi:hypothetical protein
MAASAGSNAKREEASMSVKECGTLMWVGCRFIRLRVAMKASKPQIVLDALSPAREIVGAGRTEWELSSVIGIPIVREKTDGDPYSA